MNAKDYVFTYQGGSYKDQTVRVSRVYFESKLYAMDAGISTTSNLHGMRHQAVTTWIDKEFYTAEASYMAGHLR